MCVSICACVCEYVFLYVCICTGVWVHTRLCIAMSLIVYLYKCGVCGDVYVLVGVKHNYSSRMIY
jgi:hypothetical protein